MQLQQVVDQFNSLKINDYITNLLLLVISLVIKVRQMQSGVPPLNIIISTVYFAIATLTLLVLKHSYKSQPQPQQTQQQEQIQEIHSPVLHLQKLFALSWIKNYTLLGGFFSRDKKYLLKELFIISVYAVTCLTINHVIIWPLAFIAFLLPLCFFGLDVGIKILYKHISEQPTVEAKDKKVHQAPIQSELEIEIVNIQTSKNSANEKVKSKDKTEKNMFQNFIITSICITSIILFLQTAVTISTSISNSGYLNIISLLIIVSLDQFAVRPTTGLLLLLTLKTIEHLSQSKLEQVVLAQFICQEEINFILVQAELEMEKKRRQMIVSPPRKKIESPSRVPKALNTPDQPTYLNLLSLQQTVIDKKEQEKDEVIQQIYLTTAQKDLFDQNNPQTERLGNNKPKTNKQNKNYLCFSQRRSKFPTIEEEQPGFDDLMILRDGPLHEMEDNIIAEFNLEESPPHKNKPKIPRKAKRQLNFSGSSPYLEYLPDMLKKVEGYKEQKENGCKQKKML